MSRRIVQYTIRPMFAGDDITASGDGDYEIWMAVPLEKDDPIYVGFTPEDVRRWVHYLDTCRDDVVYCERQIHDVYEERSGVWYLKPQRPLPPPPPQGATP